ncbi:hypothetical protein QAD02_002885 [Eretmocerus hayati]|uniref:Uncharacterized protein n=1 Tax=Eretmocerus hayati TaxID=131215 RepID=A0ACC2NL46_9HYME|nr:hypothetical protein QAD02_002885 [Eretmocerus hayati]
MKKWEPEERSLPELITKTDLMNRHERLKSRSTWAIGGNYTIESILVTFHVIASFYCHRLWNKRSHALAAPGPTTVVLCERSCGTNTLELPEITLRRRFSPQGEQGPINRQPISANTTPPSITFAEC